MLAFILPRTYNNAMSNELPPNDGDYAFMPEYLEWDDSGMDFLLDEMYDTEIAISEVESPYEVARLLEELSEKFEQQGISEANLYAKVHAKIRPQLLYDKNGDVDQEYLSELVAAGVFFDQDEEGYYRYLFGEELMVSDLTLFSTYAPETGEEFTHKVGLWCSYLQGDSEIGCYLHPADIDDINISQPTRDGSPAVLSKYKEYFAQLQHGQTSAKVGDAFNDWLRNVYLVVPNASSAKLEHLRIASELYIERIADFDREPYQVVVQGDIEVVDVDNEQTKYAYVENPQECFMYMHGIELRPNRAGNDLTWVPYLKASMLVEDELRDDALLIPADTILTFSPTLTRTSLLKTALKEATDDILDSSTDEEQRIMAKQQVFLEQRAAERVALQSFHSQIESYDSEAMQGMMEYMRDTVRLEDYLSVSDELVDAYNIPFLAWQDEVRRDGAAVLFRQKKLSQVDRAISSHEKQQQTLRLEEEYNQQYVRDEAMLREVLLTALQRRVSPKISTDEREGLRQRLYAKLIVDYQEPLDSNWFKLVEGYFPGEPISYDHPFVMEYAEEAKELAREGAIREAKIRNEISREFFDGIAVDTRNENYQLYRAICDELADVPFLTAQERGQRIEQLSARYPLTHESLSKIVSVMSRVLNDAS